MWPNWQETADLATFTEKILDGKLRFMCSVMNMLWKLTFPSMHISQKFASFLFGKQYELIYWVVVSRLFLS